MIAWLAAAALAAPVVQLDRVDLLAEDTPSWVADELPLAGLRPQVAASRWVEQLSVVLSLPANLGLGLSVRSASLQWERPVLPTVGLYGSGALITRFGLPTGGRLGVAFREGPLRLGLSLTMTSSATWATPEWADWRVMPAIGLGLGRAPEEAGPVAPWME